MPFCHFELEKSNYLIKRVAKVGSSISPLEIDQAKTKVLEFTVCGVGVVGTRSEVAHIFMNKHVSVEQEKIMHCGLSWSNNMQHVLCRN